MFKVENLSKNYKLSDGNEIVGIKDINLEIKEGEILGIIGTSGSGKTTLLRCLRGVEKFDEGKVIVDDVVVNASDSQYYYNQLKKVTAIHLQRNFGLWPASCRENILRKFYGAKYGDEASTNLKEAEEEFGEETDRILELVGLKDKQKYSSLVLSGGEKQRLIMGRQLAKKPKLLLLDEPATMACPRTKQEILDAVKKINKELGVTVVVVSHLPEVQKYLADRVVLMDNGEIVEVSDDVNGITNKFLSDMEPIVDIDLKASDESIIKVNDIKQQFYVLQAGVSLEMEDINFEVKKGDILTLLGPSGAGKTVLLRILDGLDEPDDGNVTYKLEKDDAGEIWVDIHKPSLNRMDVRRKVGFMYQEFALQHYATIRDQLAVKLGYKNNKVVEDAKKIAKKEGLSDELLDSLYLLTDLTEDEAKRRLEQVGIMPQILDDLFPKFPAKAVKETVADLFEHLDLSLDVLDRRSYELSGGQKVRAMLSLVLASKPDILLLDEPFGDLDPKTLRIVSNSLKKLCKEYGITIVMVSHNTDFMKELSNRGIFMNDGEILDDSRDMDKLVRNFIDFCHADYLLEE
ncbi:MAG: ATP-binding cassette domain-containing protein [Methanobrevibacter sp.]